KNLFAQSGVKIEVPGSGTRESVVNLISTLLIAALVIVLVLYQVNIGKGKNAQRLKERPAVRFTDVAGVEEAKNEVQEIVDFLKNPKKYRRLGGTLPKGAWRSAPLGQAKPTLPNPSPGRPKPTSST